MIVNNNESIASLNEPILTALCAHVTENPENIKTKVLNNGNSNTGIVYIPTGGNIDPISVAGLNAAWKNAQKNPKKSMNQKQ